MDKPIIADIKPQAEDLDAGDEYYFCTCGRSGNKSFCDGSHAGTSFAPKPFTAETDGEAWICQCKHTKNPPYCDGTHKAFQAAQAGN